MDPRATDDPSDDRDRLPDDDRDLALARTLDASGALRAGDPFESALDTLRAPASRIDPARADALRARVLAATAPDDASARPAPAWPDRAPAQRARPSIRRRGIAVVATAALLALVAGVWWMGRDRPAAPALIAEATSDQPVTATLPGGNGTAVLDGGARLSAVETRGADATVRLDGAATFDVTHRPERRFAVATPAGTVAVLGTRFRVEASATATTVTLERGSVELSTPTGETARLVPGQTATLRDGRISTPAPADGVVAETDGALAFRRTSARAVADALAARTGLVVRLPADVADETVSGTLALGEDRAALDAFADVLGGRFVPDGSERAVRFERTR